MAFGAPQHHDDEQAPMADINTTPLVDVMLVLFVIFLVTAPMLTHTVVLDMPSVEAEAQPDQQRQTLSVDAAGQLYWNNQTITREELRAHLADIASSPEQEHVDLRMDQSVTYATISELMTEARAAGVHSLGFVLEAD